MKRLLPALLVPLGALLTAAPAAASTVDMAVAIEGQAAVRAGTAVVPVTLTCSFASDTRQTSGTLTVTLVQSTRSGDTTGTGTVAITCDGLARTYPVSVAPTDGRFRPGVATAHAHAEARGDFERQMCTTHPTEGEHCDPWNGYNIIIDTDGPEEVRLSGSW